MLKICMLHEISAIQSIIEYPFVYTCISISSIQIQIQIPFLKCLCLTFYMYMIVLFDHKNCSFFRFLVQISDMEG